MNKVWSPALTSSTNLIKVPLESLRWWPEQGTISVEAIKIQATSSEPSRLSARHLRRKVQSISQLLEAKDRWASIIDSSTQQWLKWTSMAWVRASQGSTTSLLLWALLNTLWTSRAQIRTSTTPRTKWKKKEWLSPTHASSAQLRSSPLETVSRKGTTENEEYKTNRTNLN